MSIYLYGSLIMLLNFDILSRLPRPNANEFSISDVSLYFPLRDEYMLEIRGEEYCAFFLRKYKQYFVLVYFNIYKVMFIFLARVSAIP